MKSIKKLFKAIRAYRWGKRLLTEYGDRFRYFGVCYFSDDNQIAITVAYDHKQFNIMHVEKIKTYNEFSVRAEMSFSASYNDKFVV